MNDPTICGIPLDSLAQRPTPKELGQALGQLKPADIADALAWMDETLHQRVGYVNMVEAARSIGKELSAKGDVAGEFEGACLLVKTVANYVAGGETYQ